MVRVDLPRGWLSEGEADELRQRAAGLIVLELGAWKGRSTVVFSQVAKYVISVDRHKGIPEASMEDSLPDYLDAIRTIPNVAIVVASFEDIVPLLKGFELAYIDGRHDLDSVRRDVRLVAEQQPRYICFHDWDQPEVKEAGLAELTGTAYWYVGGCAAVATWERL